MSHTNSTPNYNLPQFLTTDKPAWLTDINNAFLAIDTGLDTAKDTADNAQSDATQALTDAGNASTAAATADAKGAGAVASIEAAFDATAVYAVGAKVMYNNLLYRCNVAVVTPGPWTGSANWERITVDSLIPETAGDLPLGSDFTDPNSTAYAISTKYNSSDVYVRTNNGTIASGAVGPLTYPTGFDNTALLFISCKYASGKLYYAMPQLAAGLYNIYFRDSSGTLPSGDYSWYELWIRPNA